jgi:hypothetical protein
MQKKVNIANLIQTLQDELFANCETNHEFAYGLGAYVGFLFTSLSLDLQAED